MREKPNPFVSISDLMAGVSAVIMLMLVVMVVRTMVMSAQAELNQKKGIFYAIKEISDSLDKGTQNVEVTDRGLTLKDAAFERGSACLSEKMDSILTQKIAPILSKKMKEYPNIRVYIEGHTDSLPVKNISTDIKAKCALFDDNYSLSAGRAREARKAILNAVDNDKEIAQRIAVVGYASDKLKIKKNPEAAENRRVEIRLVVQEPEKDDAE
jgi:chemotaxis protein MotB